MKISPERINQMRDIPIHDILGIEKNRRRVQVRCPFHNDRTPSLDIYDDNTFYCHGCKASGKGAIDFLSAYGMDFKKAVDELSTFFS